MTLSPRKIVIGSDSRVSPLIPITQTCATHAKMIHKAIKIAFFILLNFRICTPSRYRSALVVAPRGQGFLLLVFVFLLFVFLLV